MYKAIKDNKILAVNETGDFPCLVYDTIEEDTEHQASEFVEIGGEFALRTEEKAITCLKTRVRAVRDSYLVEYVDKVVSNPLRWSDLSSEEQQAYKDYRRYLLDYTTEESWWENNPKTFEEWENAER